MPFCPSCRSEFRDETTVCGDCNVNLVDVLDEVKTSDEEMTDLYVCYSAQHADLLARLLSDKGVEVLVRDRSSSAFPTTVGKTAKQVLAVPTTQAEQAKALIETAIADDVVPSEGELL